MSEGTRYVRLNALFRRVVRAAHVALFVRLRVIYLRFVNRWYTGSATGDLDVCLSMTTFGRRLDYVHIAIESIVCQRDRPRRIVLWLDEPAAYDNPPAALRRLQSRGLEIRPTQNYGPHKKLYSFALTQTTHTVAVATCDDDVLYPRHWLRDLVAGYLVNPDTVTGFRARTIQLTGDRIAPYVSWPLTRSSAPSYRHMLTNVSGCVYPPAFVDVVRSVGETFQTMSPKADDLWLHHVALRHDIRIRQIDDQHKQLHVIPGTQTSSLSDYNVTGGGNDAVIAALYTAEDIAKLLSEPGV